MDIDRERIDELYQAGVKRLPDAESWYDNTLANIQGLMAIYDEKGRPDTNDARTFLFIDLLAATSPQTSIVRNTFLASQLLHYINDAILCQIKMAFEAHLNNVCRSILGLPLSGQKVQAFQANLLGDDYAVTVDSWMMRAFGMDHINPTAKEYDAIAAATRQLARQYKIKPAQMQAALWVGIKALEGDPSDTPEPFEATLARFKAHEDEQGMMDFAGAEAKFKAAEAAISSGAPRELAANPGFTSAKVIGPRLKELCRVEAGVDESVIDVLCRQEPGFMMEAILYIRARMDKWIKKKSDPVNDLESHLATVAEEVA